MKKKETKAVSVVKWANYVPFILCAITKISLLCYCGIFLLFFNQFAFG